MSTENTNLWDLVSRVDSTYTKSANIGGRQETSIASLYPVKLMTQALGPIGGLWSFEIKEERLDNTRPIVLKGEILLDNGSIIWEQTHTILMNLLIRDSKTDNFSVACQQFGHTKRRYVTSRGAIMVDEEAGKKSCSDALKKCLSLFGVCADIFLGDFDNIAYRNETQDAIQLEKADEDSARRDEEMEKLKKELDDGIAAMESCPDLRSAKLVHRLKVKFFTIRLSTKNFSTAAERAIAILDQKLNEITKKNETKIGEGER